MRISWLSNAPWAPTGYGTQTAQVIRRLRDDGHDVAVLANYGLMGDMFEWEGIPVYPGGTSNYSTDLSPQQHQIHTEGGNGWLIALYDVWVLGKAFDGENIAGWAMVDSYPPPPEVAAWCMDNRTIACSKFGQEALAEIGVKAPYIPLAIDLNEWKPTPDDDIRKALHVPEDGFLVMCNAYNYPSQQPRKGWFEMFLAFALFEKSHPDAYLYLHTDPTRTGGTDLKFWWTLAGVPTEKLRIANTTQYRIGAYKTEDLAALYTTADVLLATSMGEGFGLPVIEAQACGTPVIVNDWTAQPELVGAGWKTDRQPIQYHAMKSLLALPLIPSIVEKLTAAYDARGDATLKAAALAKAQEYDADTVYAEKWRPYLAELEAALEPKPQRKGMSKSAKRRQKVAA